MPFAPENCVCVFCSSSDSIPQVYFEAAEALGALLAQRGLGLVYGGGNIGMMGVLARSVHAHGGNVIGVIPEALKDIELDYKKADELIVTRDMRERKAVMEARSASIIAMPGGMGTLEELFEMLVLKQLRYHAKALVLLNTNGFYDPLLALFEELYEQQFARRDHADLYHVAKTPEAALEYIAGYKPTMAKAKIRRARG
ncbi:MAG: TIGR00730 family Rossman fold protein [Candidatus Hydrogenedentes bacterium]|nr:TIGR00730 family Rossman fold protein [Candidatus Hydrogenedentota bacterium]